MISGTYSFLAQDRVIFGKPAAEAVAQTMDELGSNRALIVASSHLTNETNVVRDLQASLGGRCIGVYSNCIEHVPREGVLELIDVISNLNPDLIVTIGGGTPVDTVKVSLAMLGSGGRTLEDFDRLRIYLDDQGRRQIPPTGTPPIRQIIVPTTLSGAEFSSLGGCTDRKRQVKDLYWGRFIGGQVVILDPELTIHTPEWLWISTGVRAIDHAVETICSRAPQPFTDGTCLHALTILGRSLRINKADPGNLEARLESQLGVWLATTGLGRIDWGASHGIGHQLGAVANVAHGHCSCVMLPAVLEYNQAINGDRQKMVSRALGDESANAADRIRSLIKELGMPGSLSEVGVTEAHYPAIAAGAMQNMMVRSNPRPIENEKQILDILELAAR